MSGHPQSKRGLKDLETIVISSPNLDPGSNSQIKMYMTIREL